MVEQKQKKRHVDITKGPSHFDLVKGATGDIFTFERGSASPLVGTPHHFELREVTYGDQTTMIAVLLPLSKTIRLAHWMVPRVVTRVWVFFDSAGKAKFWEEADDLEV